MTRFGKSQINHDTMLSRNPSRSVVEKSISKLKASKDKIKSLTTKDIPYVGVAESAAIADLFNEPGSVNKDTLIAKFKDSDECLNSLAFTGCVDKFYKQIQTSLNQKTYNAILENFYLDERVPIMLSVGITKILSDIIEALKKTSESAISQDGVNKGKRVHFINVEDLFAYVDNKFGDVINLKQQRITDQNSNLKIYDILKDITGDSQEASLGKDHVKRLLSGLTKVDEKHVGDTFSVTITDPHTALGLDKCVRYFLSACKRVEFVTNISAIDTDNAKFAVGAIFGVIATHIMSYAFYSAIDEVLRSLDQANKKFGGAANPLGGKMFHRAMLYPSIVAALDLYGLSESEFDHVIAKEITTVKAVREVFKLAITNYDYEATAIAAKTFRHAAPKVPSFLRSPEEILEAQMKLDKMLVTAPGSGVAGAPTAVGKYNTVQSWTEGSNIYKQKAQTAMERAENVYGTWSFGRRRKSRRASFGRRRKSKRSSFGKRRKSRRSMKFGEDGTKVEVLFGRRRKSRRAAAFGKRRKSRRSMKFGNDLGDQIANQFGRRRKSRRAAAFGKRRSSKRRSMKFGEDGTKVEVLFGKRRGSKRRSMKFGNDMGDMVAGISFGKRRGSKRRSSFGKRRGSKRRSSFGKRRGSKSKRRASFGKRRGSKRRSSFGKRRGSKRRN